MARLPRRAAPRRPFPLRLFAFLLKAFFIALLVSVLWVLLYRFVAPPVTVTMLGDLLDGRGIEKKWMPIERIDRDMVRAAIAAEDGKFCSHAGFDADAIAAAMIRNAQGGRIRGGSTISQQTAKNAFLWQGGGYFRKGVEAWFTLLIEHLWTKRRIMEVYLNIAETGIGTYGVNAGAQRYYGHEASSLSRTEAARIAAVLPLPKKREAKTPTGFTRRYGNSVASRMKVVARDGLDACVYEEGAEAQDGPDSEDKAVPKAKRKEKAAAPPPEEKASDYLEAPDIGAPVDIGPQQDALPGEPEAEEEPEAEAEASTETSPPPTHP